MAKNLEVAILLDFYGELLTPKQFDVIDLYYNEDLSLGEIAQHQKITRQGVLDSIKRGETLLFEFEDKLKMLKKHREQEEVFNFILALAKNINETSSKYSYAANIAKNAKKIEDIVSEQIKEYF